MRGLARTPTGQGKGRNRSVFFHAIYRFFMQLRRSVSLLERPSPDGKHCTARMACYSLANPEVMVKFLEIYCVYYNYVQLEVDGKTPAMRLC